MRKAISHFLVGSAVIVMIGMGLWQLDRLDTKQKLNQEVEERTASALVPLQDVVGVADQWKIGESLKFRRVTAEGQYQNQDSVLIRNRSLNGAPGYWLLTPLIIAEGQAVVVNRGWIPISAEEFSPEPIEKVKISGMLRETTEASGLQKSDPSDGVLETLGRVDLQRYQEQLNYDIYPVFIHLEFQDPESQDEEFPLKLEIPKFDDGPHLNYAIQWFSFAAVFAIGYPVVLRRNKRKDGSKEQHSEIPIDYL